MSRIRARLNRLEANRPDDDGTPAHLMPPPRVTWEEHFRRMTMEELVELLEHFKRTDPYVRAIVGDRSVTDLDVLKELARNP